MIRPESAMSGAKAGAEMFRGTDEEPPVGTGEQVDEINTRYGDYVRRVRAYVRKHHPDVSAEDVTQDAMERLWRIKNRLDPGRPVEPYLFAIANNVARDIRRGRRSESAAPLYLLGPSDAEAPDEHLLRNADHSILHQAVDALDPADRNLMHLRYWRQLSCQDVSRLLRITDTAARRRLSRAQHRCGHNFKRLSPILIPLWAAFHGLLRELRRIPPMVPAAGTAGVLALAVGIGTGFMIPDGEAGAGVVIQGPALSPMVSESPAPAPQPAPTPGGQRPSVRSNPGEPDPHDARTPARPVDPPLPPVRRDLHVSPDTREGRKEAHVVEIDTPVGPVIVEGERSGNGPSTGHFACTEIPTGCPRAPEVSTDGER